MADCCIALGHIEKQCGGGNAPNLKTKIYVACVDDIESIPAKDDYPTTGAPHTVSSDIVFKAEKAFYCWNIAKTDNGYISEPQGDSDNQFWQATVNGYIPKMTPLATYILNGVANGDFILIIEDKNGYKRIIGELDDGCTIKPKEQSNDKNGYILTMDWTTSYLPLYYTGALPTAA